MNLVHMLAELQQRQARYALAEEMAKKAELNKQYEEILKQLSLRATQMIEENYARTHGIDPAFSSAGLDVLPPFNACFQQKESEWTVVPDAYDAWSKFVEGWKKAGIQTTLVTNGGKPYVRFVPIQR